MVFREESEETSRMAAASGSSSESPSRQVTVVDVYDLASNIGKDFEALIDKFGSQSVTGLMPKVISSLELLEVFASRNERENEQILTLQSTIDRLEAHKLEKKEEKRKFEKEVEQLEENYRTEMKQLWEMVQRSQEENKRLNSSLQQKEEQMSPTYAIKEEDLQMMLSLRETVDHQRDQMKVVNKEKDEKQLETESLQQQVEKLQRVNKELQRRNKVVQNQSRALVEEKADLISLLHERDHALEHMKLKLGETEKARKDLEQDKVEETQGDNVARFTLAELREVLQEKNQLKARVMELEEELSQLRPVPTPSPQPSERLDEEEVLVYGPINREPDEKINPWKCRKEAGVRKFFSRLLWRRTGGGGDAPSANGASSSTTHHHHDPHRSPLLSSSINDHWRDDDPALSVSFVRRLRPSADRVRSSSPTTTIDEEDDRAAVFTTFNLGLDY